MFSQLNILLIEICPALNLNHKQVSISIVMSKNLNSIIIIKILNHYNNRNHKD